MKTQYSWGFGCNRGINMVKYGELKRETVHMRDEICLEEDGWILLWINLHKS